MAALRHCGLRQLVVAGGVGANLALRAALDAAAAKRKARVFYPELELCTDNGAMIAFAGAMRLMAGEQVEASDGRFAVRPRWSLQEITPPQAAA
jgi:N6-L-threonylcarbamoyladenine synthase